MRYLTLLLILLASCTPRTYINKLAETSTHDTTQRVHIEVIYVPRDTIILAPLPKERAENTTRDTTSTLTTSIATSTATINGGVLHHTLQNRDTTLAVEARIYEKQTTRDTTTAVQTTHVTTSALTTTVETNRLHWWQTALCWIGALTLIIIIYKLIKQD